MRCILQNLGAIIGFVVACIGYILAIYSTINEKSSNKWELFSKLTFYSAVGVSIILLFCAISLLF